MLPLPKPPDFMASLLGQFSDGVTTLKLNTITPLLDTEESTSQTIQPQTQETHQNQFKQSNLSAIVECLHQNKEMICKDKSISWLANSPDIQLLKTLDPDLTSRGKDFYPFWNSSREEMYNRLSLPLKTDSLDSVSTSSSGYAIDTKLNSWFSTETKINHQSKNLSKTFYPSSKFLIAKGMEEEDTPSIKCKKIKLKISS